jgi:hypothetical protein
LDGAIAESDEGEAEDFDYHASDDEGEALSEAGEQEECRQDQQPARDQ